MPVTVREFVPDQLMEFGCGYDALAGEVRSSAVTGTIPATFDGGTETTFSLFKVERIEDFLETLSVSASANVQASFGKGGAKARFTKQVKIHDYSLYIALVVTVKKGTKILKNPALRKDAHQILVQDKDRFRKLYGDEYLAAITSGGEFGAVLEIRTSSRDHQERLSTQISASGAMGTTNGSASASFERFVKELVQNNQLIVTSYQRGGSDPNPVVDPAKLIDKAIGFPSTVDDKNVFDFVAAFQSYDVLPPPDGVAVSPIDIQIQQTALDNIGTRRLRLLKLAGSIDYVLQNHDEFDSFDSSELTLKLGEVQNSINALSKAASDCFADYRMCQLPTSILDVVVKLPMRLDSTSIGAVDAVRKSAEEAQKHAAACKAHSARVMAIGNAIAPGPQGSRLADEAKIEMQNAVASHHLAQKAAQTALVTGNATVITAKWAEAAKSAVQQADDALALATRAYAKIPDIGYSPYWTGPRVLVYSIFTKIRSDYGIWRNISPLLLSSADPTGSFRKRLSDFAVDPSGGELELFLEHNLTSFDDSKTASFPGFRLGQNFIPFKGTSSSIGDYGVQAKIETGWHNVAGDSGRAEVVSQLSFVAQIHQFNAKLDIFWKEQMFTLALRSKKTGISSKLDFTLYLTNHESGKKPYLDESWQIVN